MVLCNAICTIYVLYVLCMYYVHYLEYIYIYMASIMAFQLIKFHLLSNIFIVWGVFQNKHKQLYSVVMCLLHEVQKALTFSNDRM